MYDVHCTSNKCDQVRLSHFYTFTQYSKHKHSAIYTRPHREIAILKATKCVQWPSRLAYVDCRSNKNLPGNSRAGITNWSKLVSPGNISGQESYLETGKQHLQSYGSQMYETHLFCVRSSYILRTDLKQSEISKPVVIGRPLSVGEPNHWSMCRQEIVQAWLIQIY